MPDARDREIRVKGRGQFTLQVVPDVDGVTLRLDDRTNLPFWAEIRLPLSALRELIAEVEKEIEQEGQPAAQGDPEPCHYCGIPVHTDADAERACKAEYEWREKRRNAHRNARRSR